MVIKQYPDFILPVINNDISDGQTVCFIQNIKHLNYIHVVLDYLQKPVTNAGVIHLNGKGAYELNGIMMVLGMLIIKQGVEHIPKSDREREELQKLFFFIS